MQIENSNFSYFSRKRRNFRVCIFVFLISTFPSFLLAQPSIRWSKTFGGSDAESANAMTLTQDGGYVIAGYTRSNDGDITGYHNQYGLEDFCVMKIDSSGDLLWEKTLGGSDADVADGITETLDSGFVIVGVTQSIDGDVAGFHGQEDMWVVKLNKNGKLLWEKCFGGQLIDYAMSVTSTNDTGCAVAGWTLNTETSDNFHKGNADIDVLKLDKFGNLEWEKTFGQAGNDVAYSIIQTSDNGFAIAGWTAITNEEVVEGISSDIADLLVLKLNSDGEIEWQKTFGGSGNDRAHSIIQTYDGGYAITGYTDSRDGDVASWKKDSLIYKNSKLWVLKLDQFGGLIWEQVFGGSSGEEGRSIIQTYDGSFAISGITYSNDGDVTGSHGWGDGWILNVGQSGILLWERPTGGSQGDEFSGIVQAIDGSYTAAGTSESTDGDLSSNHGYLDVWLANIQNQDTLPLALVISAMDSDFTTKKFAPLSRTYKLQALRDSISLDDVSLYWKSATRFNLVYPASSNVLIPTESILRVQVNYDPTVNGSDTAFLHILSNKVHYDKTFLLLGKQPNFPQAISHIGLLDAQTGKNETSVLAGNIININIESFDSIPKNVKLRTARVRIHYNPNVISLISTQSRSGWSLINQSGTEGDFDLLFSCNTNAAVLPGGIIATLKYFAYLSDSILTDIAVTSAVFNDDDSNYSKRILALPSQENLRVDLIPICGDSTIVNYLRGKDILSVSNITPNPTSSDISIQLNIPTGYQNDGILEVYNVLENLEQKLPLIFDVLSPSQNISLSLKGSGVHYIRVSSSSGVSTKMVVVQR